MNLADIRITPFDPLAANDVEWRAFNELKNVVEAERMPGDPPESVEDHARRLRALPPSMDSLYWVAWDGSGDRALGLGSRV